MIAPDPFTPRRLDAWDWLLIGGMALTGLPIVAAILVEALIRILA